ncbi:MAG TPA: RnfH family protein [Burkholderiales bacterium]|nr:RnfH family protein [Burkholderiales bacterium]
MEPETAMAVEVVYALADEQIVVTLRVPAGTTAREAVRLSRLGDRYPAIVSGVGVFGIYGRVVTGDTVLEAGDRVEIYRELAADPKQARRRRARRKE